MKKCFVLVFLTASMIIGCKKEVPETPEKVPVKTKTTPKTNNNTAKDCYVANLEGNIIEMEIQYHPKDISGTLTYAFVGKDLNTGTFKGKMVNNILIADYTFESEGVSSERQIAFKLVDNQFVEGYGERVKNGTRFKDIAKLQFNYNMPLKKVICP
jgi:hypothetical protein